MKIVIGLSILAIVFIVIAILFSSIVSAEVDVEEILIHIKSNGVVIVEIRGAVSKGFNSIHLPVAPIPISIETYINNVLIPAIYTNETLYIPSTSEGVFHVRYVANTTSVNGKVLFKIANETVKLVIEPGIILLSIPRNIISVSYDDGNLVIEIIGPTTIEYTLATAVSTPITIPTKETHTTPTITPTTPTTTPTPFPLNPTYITIPIAAIFIVILIISSMKKRRKQSIPTKLITEKIDETDKQILRKLKELGGEAFQSDLQKALNIPKATLWRHVKRLEKLGYIEVRKELRANKLILKKRIELD